MKKLIIVESPTKANTIKKFLSKDYTVLSSYGHVRDLPKSDLGVDPEKGFKVKYVIPIKAKKQVTLLKKEAEKAELVFLATDPDREGEAISWHLIEVLKLEGRPYKRISFHEITKEAIDSALKHPSAINIDLVNAQQARRVLDRIVGYKLSPFLWKKIAKHLSAGRVQSIAIRLIVDREREILAFIPEEYWSIEAELEKNGNFTATLSKFKDQPIKKMDIKTEAEAKSIKESLEKATYKVTSIEKKEVFRHPLPPFTTSTLQQEASKKLGYPSKFTMSVAQSLYEKGLITYHRTDSLSLSTQSLENAKSFIEKEYGTHYYPGKPRKFKAKGRAQEAHEAIRPTNVNITPENFTGDEKQKKLYKLIWTRFMASQMKDAAFDSTKVTVDTDNQYSLQANGLTMKFDGFLKIYPIKSAEKEIPFMQEGDEPSLIKINADQHFTQPPARYTEASLIKEMEENEIGRPATYASIISTIQDRNYTIKNEDKRFVPTEIGFAVVDLLKEHFPNIVDIAFTAKMEKELDYVARGKQDWIENLQRFYDPFMKNLQEKYEKVEKKTVEETTDKLCPKCGKNLIIKMGRFGKFMACPGYPECKHIESLDKKEPKKTGVTCPKCNQAEIIEKRTKKGKIFYACPNWPDCDFALWDKPTGEICEKCGSLIIEKGKKKKCSNPHCK
jgi:DNA topoisomerase-1